MSKQKDMLFSEFVEDSTRYIHSALLEGGGKSMKTAVWAVVTSALNREKDGEFDRAAKRQEKELKKVWKG